MTLGMLIKNLQMLKEMGFKDNTGLLLYGEVEPGCAFNFDYLDVSINGDFVQLFMGVVE